MVVVGTTLVVGVGQYRYLANQVNLADHLGPMKLILVSHFRRYLWNKNNATNDIRATIVRKVDLSFDSVHQSISSAYVRLY